MIGNFYFFEFFRGDSYRFFYEDMFASLQGLDNEASVGIMASDNRNSIGVGVCQHSFNVGGSFSKACFFTVDDTVNTARGDDAVELCACCFESGDEHT